MYTETVMTTQPNMFDHKVNFASERLQDEGNIIIDIHTDIAWNTPAGELVMTAIIKYRRGDQE